MLTEEWRTLRNSAKFTLGTQQGDCIPNTLTTVFVHTNIDPTQRAHALAITLPLATSSITHLHLCLQRPLLYQSILFVTSFGLRTCNSIIPQASLWAKKTAHTVNLADLNRLKCFELFPNIFLISERDRCKTAAASCTAFPLSLTADMFWHSCSTLSAVKSGLSFLASLSNGVKAVPHKSLNSTFY